MSDAAASLRVIAQLAEFRAQLGAKFNAGVFDMRGFAALVQQLARRHRAGLPPAPVTQGG